MELTAAHRLATDLMAQHRLAGWTFRFDNARARGVTQSAVMIRDAVA